MVRRNTLLIFCMLFITYAYVFPRRNDWSQLSRLSLTRAIVERGTVRINAYVSQTSEYAIYRGQAYIDKPPGPSLMGVPFYAGMFRLLEYPVVSAALDVLASDRVVGNTLSTQNTGPRVEKIRLFAAQYLLTLVVIALPASVAGALLYYFLQLSGVAHNLRVLIVLAYGIGTPAATYAGNFYSHQLAASLCLCALVLLFALAEVDLDHPRAFLVGLLLGAAVISEFPVVIVIVGSGVYAWLKLTPAQVRWIVAGAALPVAVLTLYNVIAFDTIIPINYRLVVQGQHIQRTGFLHLTAPSLEAVWGLTFSLFRGLFVRAPWLLLALPGTVLWWRQQPELRTELLLLGCVVLSLLFFVAAYPRWWGGAAAGPRHLVLALPFLALLTVPLFQTVWNWSRWYRWPAQAAIVALILVSIGLTWSEAVAGQTFPPETMHNPWATHTWPHWQSGYLADNLGTVLGIPPHLSLLPLVAIILILVLMSIRSNLHTSVVPQPDSMVTGLRRFQATGDR